MLRTDLLFVDKTFIHIILKGFNHITKFLSSQRSYHAQKTLKNISNNILAQLYVRTYSWRKGMKISSSRGLKYLSATFIPHMKAGKHFFFVGYRNDISNITSYVRLAIQDILKHFCSNSNITCCIYNCITDEKLENRSSAEDFNIEYIMRILK